MREREQRLKEFFQVRGRQDAELALAALIQSSVLPARAGFHGRADISWFYSPAEEIGGDWFLFHEAPERQALWLMMGDVTGHGFGSGLLATAVVSGVRGALGLNSGADQSQTLADAASMMRVIEEVLMSLSTETPLRMSCIVLKWDYESSMLGYCNAGHTFPLLLVQQDIQPLTGISSGPLGQERSEHVVFNLTIPKESFLMLYTDGLTEARSVRGQQFGRSLYRLLSRLKDKDSPSQVLEQITGAWKTHREGQRADDDCCVLVARV